MMNLYTSVSHRRPRAFGAHLAMWVKAVNNFQKASFLKIICIFILGSLRSRILIGGAA